MLIPDDKKSRFSVAFMDIFNDKIDGFLEWAEIENIDQLAEWGQGRQEIGKAFARQVEIASKKAAGTCDILWKKSESDCKDLVDIDRSLGIEVKSTFCDNNTFSGAKHQIHTKNGQHLLIKIIIENNRVNGLWIGSIDLDVCRDTRWTASDSKKSSYASLGIASTDFEHLDVICGKIMKNQKWVKLIPTPMFKMIR